VNEVLKRGEESFTAINEMMVREVLHNYVLRILETDKVAAPFTIFSIEKPYTFRLTFKTDDGLHELMAGGNIDRVDIKDGIMRIVDYKTGITSDSIAGISDLFKDDRDKDPDAWLQTLFYCEAFLSQIPGAVVRPSVYKLKLKPGEKVTDKLITGDEIVDFYSSVREEFLENLYSALSLIFSSREPFVMTTKQSAKCRYCPFRVLCGR
jgi:ATP-dependent helicase/DNAse subunit B